MPSKAHQIFSRTFDRGNHVFSMSILLWRLMNDVDDEDYVPTVREYSDDSLGSDMGRSGIVIAVSAFDDYFTRRFCACVVPILKKQKPNKELADMLSSSGLDVFGSLELLSMKRPYRRIRSLVDRHLDTHVTQRFTAIDELYKALGIRNFSAGVEKRAKRKTLRQSVRKLVVRRHSIVHKGDLNSRGQVQDLSPKDTGKRLKDMRLFVDTAESIIDDRLKP